MVDLCFYQIKVLGITVPPLPDKLYAAKPSYAVDTFDEHLNEKLQDAKDKDRAEKSLLIQALFAQRRSAWLPKEVSAILETGAQEAEGSLKHYNKPIGCFDSESSWLEPGLFRRLGKIDNGATVCAFYPELSRIIRPYLQHPQVQERLAQVAKLEGIISSQQLLALTSDIEMACHGKRYLKKATFEFQNKGPVLELYIGSFRRWSLGQYHTEKEPQMWKAAEINYEAVK